MKDDKFQVVIHHGGYFMNEGGIKYVYGQRSELWCDEDKWSYFEVLSILREMGYINMKDLCYSVGGCPVLEERLRHFVDDVGALHMVQIAKQRGEVHMYVIHSVCVAEEVHMLEYYPTGDNGEDNTGVENDTEAEPVEDLRNEAEVESEANLFTNEVEVQCNGAEQVEPEIGEVEVQCEAEVLVNKGHVQCEAEVLEEVQCEAAE